MNPQTLRELIMKYKGEVSNATAKAATTGDVIAFAEMIEKELEKIRVQIKAV